ncbi:hypothetical protein LNKW23_29710 [Paralimibaculum aggregatum]|uniref:SGNH/GDSL hydrolase family protein n=1 Tax=Paralimibaculum aggregatum TaxID=3036245 RepID=A0ABQ6LL98_9RHOB|nr:hypothetical protein [Limibaculum sp. NKW23]GMG83757.1 hypothetical protein LNKW23_29710 [Limibaculum sp. NKW23]
MSAPTRRRFLSGAAALALPAVAPALPAAAGQPIRRVLFVGNSFLLEHGMPGRVAALAEAAGRPIDTFLVARPGATLAGHLRQKTFAEVLAWGWEAVVLQGHSLEGLTEAGRRASTAAVHAIADRTGKAALVLAVPWSRAAGHGLYADPDYDVDGPAAMTAANTAHYRRLAAETGARLAQMAAAFDTASAAGRRVHAADGYHASPAGADLAARVIWDSLAPLLP